MKYLLKKLEPLKSTIIAVAFGLVVGGIIIAMSGKDPFVAISQLLVGAFGTPYAITTTLVRSTPILLAGIAAALAWGSGYPSMGAQGQMVMGALVSAIVAVNLEGPTILVLIASIIAGMLAGMLYSFISCLISERFQIYLLIVTLMFNYIADNIASYLTTYNFRDPNAVDNLAIQTEHVQDVILPRIFENYTLHFGFIIAVIVTLIITYIINYTSFGYHTKMGGLNSNFSKYGGINSVKTMYSTLLLSGAIAGLGGAIEVFGTRFRYVDKMITSPGYSWNGITASLMANNNPIGVLFSAIFLGGLNTGGSSIEFHLGIPSEITIIIQGVITMFVTAIFIIKFKGGKKNA